MENLFLAHPLAFVVSLIVLAAVTHALAVKGIRAALYAFETRLYRNAELARARKAVDVLTSKNEDISLDAWEYADARQDIASRLLAAWTVPFRDNNGDVRHEAIDAVLVGKAFGEADLILSARGKTPIEIITTDAAPVPKTFAEMVADAEQQARANGTFKEREHAS